MKESMKKIIIIILFLSISCKSQNCKDINFQAIDFKGYKQVILEENEDNIIDGITYISFSPGGKYLLINNSYAGNIKIYDKLNGKLISNLRPSAELNDYFAINCLPINNYMGLTGEKAYMLTKARILEEVTKQGHPENFSLIINDMAKDHRYCISFFESDSIIKTIAVFDLTEISYRGLGGTGIEAYLKIDLSGNILDTTFIQPPQNDNILSFPNPSFFLEYNGSYYQPSTTMDKDIDENFEKTGVIVKIDLKGNITDIAGKLAKEYCESKIYENLHHVFIRLNRMNELIYAEQLTLRINNLNRGSSFNLKNVTIKNDSGFKYLSDEQKMYPEKKIQWDSLVKLFDTYIENLYVLENGNYMVHLKIFNENREKQKMVIQEYTPDGCLVKEMRVDKNQGLDKIKFTCYCKEEDAVVFAVQDNNCYKLIFSKW